MKQRLRLVSSPFLVLNDSDLYGEKQNLNQDVSMKKLKYLWDLEIFWDSYLNKLWKYISR